jgi:hypothetical protein
MKETLGAVRAQGADPSATVRVEVNPAAQDAYNAYLTKRFPKTIWASGCKSWWVLELFSIFCFRGQHNPRIAVGCVGTRREMECG